MSQWVANRWVQLQNLPVGPDCLKYLAMTPKAPSDIDKWMMDPPPLDAKQIRLMIRDFILAARDIITYRVEVRELTEPRYGWNIFFGILAGHAFKVSMVLLALIYIFLPQLRRGASRLEPWVYGHTYQRKLNKAEVLRHLLRVQLALALFYSFLLSLLDVLF